LIVSLTSFVIANIMYSTHQQHFNQQTQLYTNQYIDCVACIKDINATAKKSEINLTTTATKNPVTKKWQNSNDTIVLHTTTDNVCVGDIVRIYGMKCAAPSNDIRHYMFLRNIHATSFCIKKIAVLQRPNYSLSKMIHTIKNNIKHRLQKKLSPMAAALFTSIFLGYKEKKLQEQSLEQRTLFALWGIAHYMARSGLHVMLIVSIIMFSLSLLYIPIRAKDIAILLICTLYYILTWPSTSFTRAFIIIICCQLCKILKVPINMMHLLHIACIWCLILNPAILFALDFQLTFSLTYALVLIGRTYHRSKQTITAPKLTNC
jgi:ComEC/Rec2-related protein